jgi:serine/threonine-protein kinase RsbW
MVSELTSNCVRHTRSSLSVAVSCNDRRIRVEVTDAGGGTPRVQSPPPTESHGRGLRVVELLADRWGVATGPSGSGMTVWFEVPTAHGLAGGSVAP